MGPKSRVIALEFAVEPECKPHQRRDTEAQQYLDVDRFEPQGVIEFHQARFRVGAFFAGAFPADVFVFAAAGALFLPSTEAFSAAIRSMTFEPRLDRKSTRLNSSH